MVVINNYVKSLYCQSPNIISQNHLSGGFDSVSGSSSGLNPGNVSSRGSSPGPSPSTKRRPHHQSLVLGNPSRPQHGHANQNHSLNQSPVSYIFPFILLINLNFGSNQALVASFFDWLSHSVVLYNIPRRHRQVFQQNSFLFYLLISRFTSIPGEGRLLPINLFSPSPPPRLLLVFRSAAFDRLATFPA